MSPGKETGVRKSGGGGETKAGEMGYDSNAQTWVDSQMFADGTGNINSVAEDIWAARLGGQLVLINDRLP